MQGIAVVYLKYREYCYLTHACWGMRVYLLGFETVIYTES